MHMCVTITILIKICMECLLYARYYIKLAVYISIPNSIDCFYQWLFKPLFLFTAHRKKHILHTTKETYTQGCILFCSILLWLGKY